MPIAAGLYYEEHGSGPPLILSSGLGGSASYWAPNLAALAQQHRVILYDHRGTGRSERSVDGDLTLERMADDVLALLDHLAIERVTLIGHAIGGMIGMALAASHPARVERLVVINGWAKLDSHTLRCFDTRRALLRISERAYFHAQPLFLFPAQWISTHREQLLDEEEAHILGSPGADMIGRRIAAAARFNFTDRLGSIGARTLLVATDDDMLVPLSCSEALADGIPNATLAKMLTGGHAVNVTRADHFNMWLIDWLDGE